MTDEADIARHYSCGTLMTRIREGLKKAGAIVPLDPDSLAPVDEFNSGGRESTAPFIDSLGFKAGKCIIDLGCGLGGPARYAARTTGTAVVGVDLTTEFVRTAQELTTMTGQDDRVKFVRANVLDLPFTPGLFDGAMMIHVGMNIADKHRIAKEAARVLKPGSIFGIYDIMRLSEDDITYPLPWATNASQSSVVHCDRYHFALEAAGFEILKQSNCSKQVLEYYAEEFAGDLEPGGLLKHKANGLGMHLVMGANSHQKIKNMVLDIRDRRIAPMIIIARLAETSD